MKLQRLDLTEVRSYSGENRIEFSPGINLLVGPNNCGKSTIIAALKILQGEQGRMNQPRMHQMIRKGKGAARIRYVFSDLDESYSAILGPGPHGKNGAIQLDWTRTTVMQWMQCDESGTEQGKRRNLEAVIPSEEPKNLFYYFLNSRRPQQYQGGIGRSAEARIGENYMFLPAKIDRLSSLGNPKTVKFQKQIKDILGISLCAAGAPSDNQKVAGMYCNDAEDFIELDELGAGVSQVAALLADLTMARHKIFLIEEPENDLHPEALVKLLREIRAASSQNQFIISTHSNIVVSRLGADPTARVLSLQLKNDQNVPTTSVTRLGESAAERAALLERLGYTVEDFGLLHSGYLLLEESSAEHVIRNAFMPLFTPGLVGRVKTFASGGVGKVVKRFEAIHGLFVFLHTTEVYRNRTWVRIDAGEDSQEVILRLRDTYGEPNERFGTWQKSQFEHYYPPHLSSEVTAALGITDRIQKAEAKGALARKVVEWALANPDEARRHFSAMAADVIAALRAYENLFES